MATRTEEFALRRPRSEKASAPVVRGTEIIGVFGTELTVFVLSGEVVPDVPRLGSDELCPPQAETVNANISADAITRVVFRMGLLR